MSWRTILSFLLLILSVAGLIWMILYAQSLRRTVVEQRREIDAGAVVSANNLYLEDAGSATDDLLLMIADLCGPDRPDLTRFCAERRYDIEVARLFNRAAIARATAAPDGYGQVRRDYQTLYAAIRPDANHGPPWVDGYRARALEGVAYAELKQGSLAEAERTIARAARLDDGAAMVGVTALKIACSRNADATSVRNSLESLRQRLAARLAAVGRPEGRYDFRLRDARAERALPERDLELYRLCAYAGIERQPGF